MTLGRELRALNGMNDIGSWMRRTNMGHELRALIAMNHS